MILRRRFKSNTKLTNCFTHLYKLIIVNSIKWYGCEIEKRIQVNYHVYFQTIMYMKNTGIVYAREVISELPCVYIHLATYCCTSCVLCFQSFLFIFCCFKASACVDLGSIGLVHLSMGPNLWGSELPRQDPSFSPSPKTRETYTSSLRLNTRIAFSFLLFAAASSAFLHFALSSSMLFSHLAQNSQHLLCVASYETPLCSHVYIACTSTC